MLKKIVPKNTIDPPSAKRDSKGNLVTSKEELEQLYLDTYVKRLSPNPVKEDLKDIFELKDMLFDLRIEESKLNVTPDWTMDELEIVLKGLKNNKARDAHGHVYELFKHGGQALKSFLLQMFNLIKKQQVYPEILQPSNISSFYKQKGKQRRSQFG